MVEHLLRSGAEPSLLDRHGYTVAHYAAFSGNKHALEMVVEKSNALSLLSLLVLNLETVIYHVDN